MYEKAILWVQVHGKIHKDELCDENEKQAKISVMIKILKN